MPGIMEYYSEDALEYIGRIAYIPTNHPTYIWKNHVLCQKIIPFWIPVWDFIRHALVPTLGFRRDPREASSNAIMQFKLKTDDDGDNEENLDKPVFMATFYALWSYRNRGRYPRKRIQEGDAHGKGGSGNGKESASEGRVGGRQLSHHMSTIAFGEGLTQDKMVWRKALFQLARSKFLLHPSPVIECHDFSLEFLDNPAIAALVTFKWETIGFKYWFLQFFFQFIYYALVVTAALYQVFILHVGPLGLFITHVFERPRAAFDSEPKYSWVSRAFEYLRPGGLFADALINVAFAKGDDAWRLAWIKSRLRYIESAENLSYDIPGFRQTYDWFPKEIYFTATAKEIEDYLKKHPESRREEPITKFESQQTTSSRTFSNTDVDTLNADGTSRYQNEAMFSSTDTTPRNDAIGTSSNSALQSLLHETRGSSSDVQQQTASISSQITTLDDSRPSSQSQQTRQRRRLIVEEEEEEDQVEDYEQKQEQEQEMGKGKGRGRKEEASNKDMGPTVVMELFRQLESQMQDVLRETQESHRQALELQRQESQKQMELSQQQMQALIDRMIQLTSSIPASSSSSL
ncbi:hypothetical protein BGZ95_003972 [Linnemannia exigua]|uniref:Uncharacterized protein n=1 Tax=Linnemannia exigua TaxID=604196 RepID=A0AAD4H3C7_9FUNG|nr:hypothetical protein BGZ95_003972 [Linnemannia exigua]